LLAIRKALKQIAKISDLNKDAISVLLKKIKKRIKGEKENDKHKGKSKVKRIKP
jgi:hypothetical protein